MSGHHFPDDILLDIFLRLPVKSISRFRCVSKSMCSLLQSPNFIQMHLNHSIENDKFSLLVCRNIDGESSINSIASRSDSLLLSDYEAVEIDYPFEYQNPSVEIVASCNGLVCLELNNSDVCIWNPSTTEFKKIKTLPDKFKCSLAPEWRGKAYSYGFGYDSGIRDYKLVRFERWENIMYFSTSSIYTLGTNTWKKLPAIRYDVTIFGAKPGVHIDGILYFIAVQTQNHGDGSICCLLILSFNVCDESVSEIDLPASLVGIDGKVGLSLGVFGGNLCLVCDIVGVQTDVWVMKDCGQNKGNWTKLVTMKGFRYPMPLHFFKTGEILFELWREEVDDPNGVVLYDPKHKRGAALEIRGTQESFCIQSYVPSLVSLKSGTFVKERLRKGDFLV